LQVRQLEIAPEQLSQVCPFKKYPLRQTEQMMVPFVSWLQV